VRDEAHNAACRAYAKISRRMADGAAIDSAIAAWCEAEADRICALQNSPTTEQHDRYGADRERWLRRHAAALREGLL